MPSQLRSAGVCGGQGGDSGGVTGGGELRKLRPPAGSCSKQQRRKRASLSSGARLEGVIVIQLISSAQKHVNRRLLHFVLPGVQAWRRSE
jgi:hypothetical protein